MSSTLSTSSLSSAYDSVKSTLSSVENNVEKLLSTTSNKYLTNILLVLLVIYAPVAAPSLGPSMVGILNNYAVKFLYMFLLAYLLSKSVKVATLTALIIVVGILVLKQMSGSEHLTNVSAQESESEKPGFVSSLFNLSKNTMKESNKLTADLGLSRQGVPQMINTVQKYTPESKPELEVAKAVAKAQAVAVAQAEAHADKMEEIKAVTQNAVAAQSAESVSLSDSMSDVCEGRSPTEVVGYDENDSEYSDVSFSKSDGLTC